jgi:hypothetical protein
MAKTASQYYGQQYPGYTDFGVPDSAGLGSENPGPPQPGVAGPPPPALPPLTPFAPPAPSGGAVAPAATAAPVPNWMDQSQPGMQEQQAPFLMSQLQQPTALAAWAGQNAGQLNAPSAATDYWNGVAGKFNAMPGAAQNAQTAYDNYERQRQTLDALPGLDLYYDRQRQKTTEDLNRQLMARGAFGSSRGTSMISDALVGLGAEQANREADYALNRDEAARNWASGGVTAAQSADASSRGAGELQLAQLLGGGQLAGAATEGDLARLMAAAEIHGSTDSQRFERTMGTGEIAGAADTRRQERIDSTLGGLLTVGGKAADITAQGTQELLGKLMEMSDAEIAAIAGGDQAKYAQLMNARASLRGDIGAAASVIGAVK